MFDSFVGVDQSSTANIPQDNIPFFINCYFAFAILQRNVSINCTLFLHCFRYSLITTVLRIHHQNQIQFSTKPPFQSFDNQPHNQKPPSRNFLPQKQVDYETWTIDFGRILRNTVIDLRYATEGQTFENAVSIRKLARPNTFSNPPGISSCSSSGVRSAHGAGSRKTPIDLSKDFQLFSDPESPCCAGSLFPF